MSYIFVHWCDYHMTKTRPIIFTERHIRRDTPKRQSLVPVSTFRLPCPGAKILFWLQLQLLKKPSCVDDDALQAIPWKV